MKIIKLTAIFAALIATISLSSCLGDTQESNPTGYCYATVRGDRYTGYRFYVDNGGILSPSTSSITTGIADALDKAKRVIVSYELLDKVPENPTATTVYNINFLGGSVIPTKGIVDTYDNTQASDTLAKTNCTINSWYIASAYKGYITLQPTFYYSTSKTPYFDLAFDSSTDIDVENKKITLTAYLDTRDGASTSAQGVYSFAFPSELYGKFSSNDSIDIEVKAYGTSNSSLTVLKKRISRNDFLTPSGY